MSWIDVCLQAPVFAFGLMVFSVTAVLILPGACSAKYRASTYRWAKREWAILCGICGTLDILFAFFSVYISWGEGPLMMTIAAWIFILFYTVFLMFYPEELVRLDSVARSVGNFFMAQLRTALEKSDRVGDLRKQLAVIEERLRMVEMYACMTSEQRDDLKRRCDEIENLSVYLRHVDFKLRRLRGKREVIVRVGTELKQLSVSYELARKLEAEVIACNSREEELQQRIKTLSEQLVSFTRELMEFQTKFKCPTLDPGKVTARANQAIQTAREVLSQQDGGCL